jgi:hypothetical protein
MFRVDPELEPSIETVPSLEDGVERVVRCIADADGARSELVDRELIVLTDDPQELADFLARTGGEVLMSSESAERGMEDLPLLYLVRVDTGVADIARLPDDIFSLEPENSGQFTACSDEALALLSISASEATRGLTIGVNWRATPSGIDDGVTDEAPVGPNPSFYSAGYSSDAFQWPH